MNTTNGEEETYVLREYFNHLSLHFAKTAVVQKEAAPLDNQQCIHFCNPAGTLQLGPLHKRVSTNLE